MPVRMPVRQAPGPAGNRRGQPGQWEQSEETLTIPALEGIGEEAVQEPGEEAPASGATEGSQVWDGRDVSFPPLRPSAGRPVHPGDKTRTGERGTSKGRARSGCSPSESPSEPPPEPPSEPLWASAPVGTGRGRRAAQVLAVTGARGGLGASVLLLHLAWALGRAGRRVAMMDLDPTGGLDLLCGQSVLTGLRWADLPAEESVLEAMRAEHDVVLVDLPRGASPPPGAGVLIVTGLDLRSAVAAESIASRLRGTAPAAVVAADAEAAAAADAAAGVPVWLVARQVGEDVLAEDLELITGCPVLGQVPTDRVLAKRLALGEDPVRARSALRRAAGALARELLPRLADAAAPGTCSLNQSASRPTSQSVNQSGDQSRRQSWSR